MPHPEPERRTNAPPGTERLLALTTLEGNDYPKIHRLAWLSGGPDERRLKCCLDRRDKHAVTGIQLMIAGISSAVVEFTDAQAPKADRQQAAGAR